MEIANIWSRLKNVRVALHLSQKAMGETAGIPQKDISQLENGKKKFIPIEYILYLYERGVNLNWLFGGQGEMLQANRVSGYVQNDNEQESLRLPEPVLPYHSSKSQQRIRELEAQNQKLKIKNDTLMEVIRSFSRDDPKMAKQ